MSQGVKKTAVPKFKQEKSLHITLDKNKVLNAAMDAMQIYLAICLKFQTRNGPLMI
jgi:hypothetical protein